MKSIPDIYLIGLIDSIGSFHVKIPQYPENDESILLEF